MSSKRSRLPKEVAAQSGAAWSVTIQCVATLPALTSLAAEGFLEVEKRFINPTCGRYVLCTEL